jgi:hypothetical protein
MPSLAHAPERHAPIDRRPGHYLCFPDVCRAADGQLVAVYNEFDRHVATRRKVLARRSPDGGRTWGSRIILNAADGHCPRATVLSDGEIVVLDDSGVFRSLDHGRSFASHPHDGLTHAIPDRPLELSGERLLTAGHLHRGTHARARTRQPTTEQMCYRSGNRGRTWEALSVLAHDRDLVLCEASLVPLGRGRILAFLRENSFVGEPLYRCESLDNGRTWSLPRPTPVVGHRPCAGLTPSGRLLITYRDVGPRFGLRAWLADPDDPGDFLPHGLRPDPGSLTFTRAGMRVKTGPDAPVRFLLRPLTDPDTARAELTFALSVDRAEEKALAVHCGGWWRIFPDRVDIEEPEARDPDRTGTGPEESGRRPAEDRPWASPDSGPGAGASDGEPGPRSTPLGRGRTHELRFRYEAGRCVLAVDGETRLTRRVDPAQADARIIGLGCRDTARDNAGSSLWKAISLRIAEPRYLREYAWSWKPGDGTPDAALESSTLLLREARGLTSGDFGYSGWTTLADGRFFCAHHWSDPAAPGYVSGERSEVWGVWFSEEDFG